MNHLARENSPYLLQHAENPVDWYPWGPQALEKARREDRPIFLSIGYAACHWCHVMAHESFEDSATAAYMNAHFVNIKVDREERPDLDSIYMQAVVALTGQGGWPMSVFLTPDGIPFYGGTYFPPVQRYNMPAFIELLQAVAHAWENDRPSLLDNGQQILDHIRANDVGARYIVPLQTVPLRDSLEQADQLLAQSYDWTHGGWGQAPRFPQPMTIEYLLRRATRVSVSADRVSVSADRVSASADRRALDMALHVLQAMAKGGMYDVVGGGFARYSTDDLWRTPHFEKMLYDNTQLARVYLHAWLVCRDAEAQAVEARDAEGERRVGAQGLAPLHVTPQQVTPLHAMSLRRVCEQTLDFVLREMTHPLGGFYSSLDADSEGVEGKFYVWTPQEIQVALGNARDADFVIAAYQVTEAGNFEGKNILQRALSDEQLAERFGLDAQEVPVRLEALHARLLAARSQRIRPATDDKILVSWNALMLATFAEAGRYLDRPDYLAAAQRNARFLLEYLYQDERLMRSWREPQPPPSPLPSPPPNVRAHLGEGEPPPQPSPKWESHLVEGVGGGRHTAYLEDYATLILGLLALYQADADGSWYTAALRLADEMAVHYADPTGGFFDTRNDAEELLYRPKDLQDNATPSGSALAACALLQLAAYGDRLDGRGVAEAMLGSMQELISHHPTAFAQWLQAADFALGPVHEVAVVGEAGHPLMEALLEALWKRYRPRLVAAVSVNPAAPGQPPTPGAPALLNDRPLKDGLPTAYVCQGFVCKRPVNSVEEMERQLVVRDASLRSA